MSRACPDETDKICNAIGRQRTGQRQRRALAAAAAGRRGGAGRPRGTRASGGATAPTTRPPRRPTAARTAQHKEDGHRDGGVRGRALVEQWRAAARAPTQPVRAWSALPRPVSPPASRRPACGASPGRRPSHLPNPMASPAQQEGIEGVGISKVRALIHRTGCSYVRYAFVRRGISFWRACGGRSARAF